jgi:hypothetical protein
VLVRLDSGLGSVLVRLGSVWVPFFFCFDLTLVIFLFLSPADDFFIFALYLPLAVFLFFCFDLTLVIFLFLSPAYDLFIFALHLPLAIFLVFVSISHL